MQQKQGRVNGCKCYSLAYSLIGMSLEREKNPQDHKNYGHKNELLRKSCDYEKTIKNQPIFLYTK